HQTFLSPLQIATFIAAEQLAEPAYIATAAGIFPSLPCWADDTRPGAEGLGGKRFRVISDGGISRKSCDPHRHLPAMQILPLLFAVLLLMLQGEPGLSLAQGSPQDCERRGGFCSHRSCPPGISRIGLCSEKVFCCRR
uniref:Beta-defensin-like domain-containing protein n=1 Tax=Meleagris gallopavo TaxID=9103 RepID=A0A803XN95_MELGA